ncbi:MULTISPECIES: galactonate dehydratase [Halomicrobium]|uniref:Mandelate racemase/muconate lactonizing protein n=2 Tax=Halomicrobium mukohataei TaxID=57705 RepID=C7NWB9_HALMD|nr:MULTISPECIES: galactonate dehydratase [Halomicrobium]ACV46260.1 Mandelate racemase/muconate lactonizing protein [Halomicrobium mukohataei DSM 12286]QCD64821.1 galactonate dehydratase [Halomicrobium mukohataei]QFR19628.1 galactonate dehydratase [Halomicrobium sp. ZPS1]
MSEITDYELFEVPPRWLFLRIETSDGLVGWGEPVVEGRARTVRTAVEELMDNYLLGEDPSRIEDHWQTMYRGGFYRGGPVLMSAIAGIDQALWDIKGKHFDAPVHELLGGKARDRIRVYQWIGGDRPSDVAEQAREQVEAGFTALKMNATEEIERVDDPATIQAAVDRLRQVREAVGDEVDIGVDFHGRVTKPMAKRLVEELAPYEPMFVEEPVLPEHNDALPEIAQHTTTPIATGERMFSRWDYKSLFENGTVDVIQPDLSHAGGITEVKKIAAMAEAYDVAMAPHCPLGPIALASCLQVDATAANAFIQEQSLDIHYNETSDVLDYLADPAVFDYDDGYVEIPDDPGLGVEIDEEYVREQAELDHDWHNPVWRHDDGSVAEW